AQAERIPATARGAAELGHIYTRQQADLCFQFWNKISIRDQYQRYESGGEYPGRRGAQTHQYFGDALSDNLMLPAHPLGEDLPVRVVLRRKLPSSRMKCEAARFRCKRLK